MKGYSRGRKIVFVLDTPAFFAGVPLMAPADFYTTPEVISEVKDRDSRFKLEIAESANRVSVIDPGEPRSIESILPRNLLEKLSYTDKKVLELAYKLRSSGFRVVVLTDDYALQESCLRIGVEFKSIRTRGISKNLMEQP